MRCFRQALPVLLSGWVLAGAPSAAADCGLVTVTATTVDFHRYRPSDPQPKDAVGELRVQCSGFGTDSTW